LADFILKVADVQSILPVHVYQDNVVATDAEHVRGLHQAVVGGAGNENRWGVSMENLLRTIGRDTNPGLRQVSPRDARSFRGRDACMMA
jgi:hypothetical protein